MDKNTPLSSLPHSDSDMDARNNNIPTNKVENDPTEPSVQVINNILNYSKALKVTPTQTVVEHFEYLTN